MSNAQTTAPTATPVFVLAPISTDAGAAAIKGLVAAARANQTAEAKAKRDYLANTVAAARLIGVPLTSAQFDRQVAKSLRDALSGKVDDVTSALSRAKVVTLATLCGGGADFAPVMGEGINAYLTRVRPLLEKANLPDGTPVFPKAADGTVTGKRGAKAGSKKPAKPAASAGDASKQEGGDNAPAKLRAAQILMGDTEAAKRLVIVAESYRDQFEKWSAQLLSDGAANAVQAAMQRARETTNAKRNGAAA